MFNAFNGDTFDWKHEIGNNCNNEYLWNKIISLTICQYPLLITADLKYPADWARITEYVVYRDTKLLIKKWSERVDLKVHLLRTTPSQIANLKIAIQYRPINCKDRVNMCINCITGPHHWYTNKPVSPFREENLSTTEKRTKRFLKGYSSEILNAGGSLLPTPSFTPLSPFLKSSLTPSLRLSRLHLQACWT